MAVVGMSAVDSSVHFFDMQEEMIRAGPVPLVCDGGGSGFSGECSGKVQ